MLRVFGYDAIAFPRGISRRTILADVTSANVAAGMTAGLFYAFGAVPVHLDAMRSMQLGAGAASSWFFIIFMTSAISSLVLSLKYRMPLPIGWSMPGLIFLATAAGHYTHAEIAGACMMAGLVILALGLLGIGERLTRWIPLPIVMGMFAGTVLGYVTGIFRQLEMQPLVVGATIAGYLAASAMRRVWSPPMAGAVIGGIGAAVLTGRTDPGSFAWSAPIVAPMTPSVDPASILTLTVPLVVMAVGIGNVQGFGVLAAQGYRPPIRVVTVWMGVTTIINAAFGGHVSSIQSNGAAVLGSPDAGPRDRRYVASVIASLLAVLLGLCAATAGTIIGILPLGLVPAIAGLALLTSLIDSLRKSALSDVPMGAVLAFVIAGSGVVFAGIGAAFWALIGGVIVSLLLERPAIRAIWKMA